MMRGEAPNDRAAPIVTHPHCFLGAQRLQEFEHVFDDYLDLVFMALIDARAPVTSHVRRDGAEPQARKTREMMAPTNRKFRPTVRENDERSPGSPTGQVERRVPGRFRYVLDCRNLAPWITPWTQPTR